MENPTAEYYLQVVKDDDFNKASGIKWPKGEDELITGSQHLGGGFIQYWAYLKDSGKDTEDLPHAEVIAAEHKADKPAILIDQYDPSGELELVVVKDGHAWGKAESSVDNLEDNISSLLDFAKNKFSMEVEHFMTTSRVPQEVEKKLDDLEEAGGKVEHEEAKEEKIDPQTAVLDEQLKTKPPAFYSQKPVSSAKSFVPRDLAGSSSKIWMVIPTILVLLVFGGAVMFKDQIISKMKGGESSGFETSVVTSTPTPTPKPEVDRSRYKVRVLNGTTKIGAAAALGDELKALGWQVFSVGNATNSANPQTYVRVKKDLTEAQAILVADLAPDLSASASSELPASDGADAEVVIGKK